VSAKRKPAKPSKPSTSKAKTDAGRRVAAIRAERRALTDIQLTIEGKGLRERIDIVKALRRLDEEEADLAFAAATARLTDPEERLRRMAERAQASGSWVAAAQLERQLAQARADREAAEAARRDAEEARMSAADHIELLVADIAAWPVHEAVELLSRLQEVLAPAMAGFTRPPAG
jgi:hypothetical protein